MEIIKEFVFQIAVYGIFASVIVNLVPEGTYKKYVKVFVGIIYMFVILKPWLTAFDIDVIVKEAFKKASIENDANDLKNMLFLTQNEANVKLIDNFENEILNEINNICIDYRLTVKDIEIIYNKDLEELDKIDIYVSNYSIDTIYIDAIALNESKNYVELKNEIAEFLEISDKSINIITK